MPTKGPMRVALALGVLVLTTGCATSRTAAYLDSKTGHLYFCYRQLAFGVIPTVVSNNSYADCKNEFEGRGFVRDRGEGAAGSIGASPAAPPPGPAEASSEKKTACWTRVTQSGEPKSWAAAYDRCLTEP